MSETRADARQDPRRAYPRVRATFRVRFNSVEEVLVAYSENLSRGGIFLCAPVLLPENTVLHLVLELPPPMGELPVTARVAFVRDRKQAQSSGTLPGMGLEFIDLEGEGVRRIERILAEADGGKRS